MLDNLTILAIVIMVFWLGAIAFYFYTSRQQREIQAELNELRDKLDELEEMRE